MSNKSLKFSIMSIIFSVIASNVHASTCETNPREIAIIKKTNKRRIKMLDPNSFTEFTGKCAVIYFSVSPDGYINDIEIKNYVGGSVYEWKELTRQQKFIKTKHAWTGILSIKYVKK